jgi:hypothetical protein
VRLGNPLVALRAGMRLSMGRWSTVISRSRPMRLAGVFATMVTSRRIGECRSCGNQQRKS